MRVEWQSGPQDARLGWRVGMAEIDCTGRSKGSVTAGGSAGSVEQQQTGRLWCMRRRTSTEDDKLRAIGSRERLAAAGRLKKGRQQEIIRASIQQDREQHQARQDGLRCPGWQQATNGAGTRVRALAGRAPPLVTAGALQSFRLVGMTRQGRPRPAGLDGEKSSWRRERACMTRLGLTFSARSTRPPARSTPECGESARRSSKSGPCAAARRSAQS
ncbi:hypothetical protein B0J12DRAFT_73218 [Macrophomina phaseolina]|uniref:Uncharacterized protein n=1 Tax=Macrophomina phaseolina TaxID=35725 RepID=A0ABQ8FPW6_9PEZI|nr:hypothetical protein B0J12DRAFT_73218 [Macrophomina phaseolina]